MSELDDAVVTARLRKATMEAALAHERTRLEQAVADFIGRMNGAANPGASHIQCDVVVVRGLLVRRRHHEIVRLPDLGWRVGDAGLHGVADVLTIRGEWFDRTGTGSAAGWVGRGTLTAELPAELELAHQRVSDTLNLLGRLLENNRPLVVLSG